MYNCLRTVLWRDEANHMYEYGSLVDTGEGTRLAGVMAGEAYGRPLRAVYEVLCDRQGLTRSVQVDVAGGLGEHHIRLTVDDRRAWRLNEVELPDCEGCPDVDLGFSPSTNALPIRRMSLAVGDSQTLSVAWLRFPELDVRAARQRYTRLEPNRYLFESLLDGFKAELVVDELGMVLQYGALWQAIATGHEC